MIEAKDEYRARFSKGTSKVAKMAGPSPDRLDAFLLTFVKPRARPVKEEKAEIWMPGDPVFGY